MALKEVDPCAFASKKKKNAHNDKMRNIGAEGKASLRDLLVIIDRLIEVESVAVTMIGENMKKKSMT